MVGFGAAGALAGESADALAVPVFSDRRLGPGAKWAVGELGDWVAEYLDAQDFRGSAGQVVSLPSGGRLPYRSLFLIGLGEEVDGESLRRGAGSLGRATVRYEKVATTLHQVDVPEAGRTLAEGFLMGQYRFDRYRSQPKPVATREVKLIGEGGDEAERAASIGKVVAEAVLFARDLVNQPSADKSPEELAGQARQMAEESGLRVVVHDEDSAREAGFSGLLAVGAGAHRPPRMVELWYEPPGARTFLALVGKGIVFDSGGLSLKKAEAMETMKTDMSGAAAIFGAMRAISAMRLGVKVLGVAPLTENMPGGGAQRPGDVIRFRNGKTVEVLNTDAEGRLVLADGLSLAAEAGPDLIVDLATLTGACRIALGDKIAGLWCNDDRAADLIQSAAARAGERVWPMPLPEDYRKQIDSDVADMKNTGGRYGGAISAALLLREFVGDQPWAHLDIAGPARWPEDEHYQSKGGSGFGVRTLVALAEALGEPGNRAAPD